MMHVRIGECFAFVTIVPILPLPSDMLLSMSYRSTSRRFATPRGQWLVPCFAAALLVTGCTTHSSVQLTEDAESRQVVFVKTLQVQEADVKKTTTQPATVAAFFRSEIKPMATGYVSEIRVDIGDVVTAGDVLFVIDVPEQRKQIEVLQAKVKRMLAEQERATAGITLADAQVSAAEASLEEARSDMASVEAALAAAEAEYSRTEDLVQRGSLQQRMLDEVTQKRDSQRAARQSVRSSIQSAQANVTVANAQRSAAVADLKVAEAETEIAARELEQLEVLLQYATVTAPIDGVITARNVEPGNQVTRMNESDQPLMVISQMDRVRVHVPVPEVDAAWVNPGDDVTLTFPSYSDQAPIEATVTRQSGELDASTRTMLVEVELENESRMLLPGMFGQALIQLDVKTDSAQLPSRAIRFREDGQAYVYVLRPDQSVAVTTIETGADDGSLIEIISGVPVGTEVIDAHLQRFEDGQTVSVLPTSS